MSGVVPSILSVRWTELILVRLGRTKVDRSRCGASPHDRLELSVDVQEPFLSHRRKWAVRLIVKELSIELNGFVVVSTPETCFSLLEFVGLGRRNVIARIRKGHYQNDNGSE